MKNNSFIFKNDNFGISRSILVYIINVTIMFLAYYAFVPLFCSLSKKHFFA